MKTNKNRFSIFALIFFSAIGNLNGQTPKFPIYRDSTKSIEKRVEDLLSRMTREEKVEQLSGKGFITKGNARLGIPEIIMYDQQAERKAKRHSVNFSATINWAATFDEVLIYKVGVSLGQEVRVLGANMLHNPCLNILRAPLHGRSFEAFGEDPYLVSRMAVAYVKGAQSQKVITCPKHFVANNQDWNRFEVDVHVDERTLREIYFPAYKAAIQQGGAWSLMTAYNRVRGFWCAENKYLLTDVLSKNWGFTGFIVSDWGGTHSTLETATAGLDLEMPEGRFMGEALLQLVKDGRIEESVIDKKVKNILRVMFKAGLFDESPADYGGIANTPERRKLARKVAQESIVLLKNEDNFLPLDKKKIGSIAVIGPNSKQARVTGSGSGAYFGYYQISPLQGIINNVGQDIKIKFERGIPQKRIELPIADSSYYLLPDSETKHGVVAEYFNNRNVEGEAVLMRIEKAIDFDWGYGPIRAWGGPGSPAPGVVRMDGWSARWTGKFVSPGDGLYDVGVQADNGIRLYLDGKLFIDSWTDAKPSKFKIRRFKFEAGRNYDFRLEFYENWGSCMCKLGVAPYIPAKTKQNAIDLAKKSDVVVLCLGLNAEMEGESADREELSLPKEQIELIKSITAANKNSLVVLNNGTPITMSEWIGHVPAIIDVFYPGQEGGNALADIIFGDISPSGRLPMTFPRRWEDSPAYGSYPGSKEVAEYSEGIFVGYRYFDKMQIEPLFPFGHGLSYTTFVYSNLAINPQMMGQKDTLTVQVTIKNTGTVAGAEVVQLYVRDVKASVEREVKSLKGFQRVYLKPGEEKTKTFRIDKRALAFYSEKSRNWVVEPGRFKILVGSSSRDILAAGEFEYE